MTVGAASLRSLTPQTALSCGASPRRKAPCAMTGCSSRGAVNTVQVRLDGDGGGMRCDWMVTEGEWGGSCYCGGGWRAAAKMRCALTVTLDEVPSFWGRCALEAPPLYCFPTLTSHGRFSPAIPVCCVHLSPSNPPPSSYLPSSPMQLNLNYHLHGPSASAWTSDGLKRRRALEEAATAPGAPRIVRRCLAFSVVLRGVCLCVSTPTPL